jgi:hypothetical protein
VCASVPVLTIMSFPLSLFVGPLICHTAKLLWAQCWYAISHSQF